VSSQVGDLGAATPLPDLVAPAPTADAVVHLRLVDVGPDAAPAGIDRLVVAPPTRSRWQHAYVRAMVGLDVFAGVAAGGLAYLGRFGEQHRGANFLAHLALSLALPPLWVAVVAGSRAYEGRFAGSGTEEFKRVANAAIRTTALIAFIGFAFHYPFARGYVVIALPVAASISLSGRLFAHRALRRHRRAGTCLSKAVLVGHEIAVLELATEMRRHPDAGVEVVAACLTTAEEGLSLLRGQIPVFAGVELVPEAVRLTGADTVAVAAGHDTGGSTLRRLSWVLEGTGVDLLVDPALTDIAGPRIHVRPVSGLPLLHVEEPQLTGARRLLKVVFDRVCASLLLLVCAPLMLVVALSVRLETPGPALFRQRRVGREGHEFTIVKFRSMYADAEDRLAQLRDRNECADGPLFKLRDDPRVTRVGRRLRRFSLDELPQLLNVIRGDMSLVGPRPPLPCEVASYGDDVRRRLLVKPGLTGLWQVSGRSDLSWDEAVRLDLHYVENWSLALDVLILARTAAAVLARRGAY
jgi:exopolysaccharide biosynthesis polyprenyl glycosylphosphotransferase